MLTNKCKPIYFIFCLLCVHCLLQMHTGTLLFHFLVSLTWRFFAISECEHIMEVSLTLFSCQYTIRITEPWFPILVTPVGISLWTRQIISTNVPAIFRWWIWWRGQNRRRWCLSGKCDPPKHRQQPSTIQALWMDYLYQTQLHSHWNSQPFK